MKVNYVKQHAIGLAGLALLRNWLIGDEANILSILDEVSSLSALENSDLFEDNKKANPYDVKEGYKAWATTYDDISNILIDVEEPIVKSILRKFTPGRSLDAACGTGRYSVFLQKLNHKVTGVDKSSAMLSKAKARNRKIHFIRGDLTALPLKDASFDLAVSTLVMTHFPNINSVLSELSRVVCLGGHIVISDIHPWLVALGAHAEFYDDQGNWGYIKNYIHWHSNYIQAFKLNGLVMEQCLEPTIKQKNVDVAKEGFKLSTNTVAAALKDLPVALIWVLKKT